MEQEKSVEEYVRGLREMADFIEAHPALTPHLEANLVRFSETAAEFGLLSLELGTATRVGTDDYARTERKFGPHVLKVATHRATVCERVVVGSEERVIEEPDPEAVAALPKVTRTEVVEQVEWRCAPLHELARQ